ncbi:Serine-rich protein-related [Hibiscus syriacus]|uniref:Serine-rich protein-related n=1 Tax=Hibiscus syriacus TaxID=106335 RepID=A0A6A3APK0_HIBSY|nr:Serine-rich protein-related [Hibiscus syriacus]
MATSSRRNSGPVLRSSPHPAGFAFSSSSFSSRSSTFFNQHRSISPPRINIYNHSHSAPSVRFTLDSRPISPNRSVTTVRRNTEVVRNLGRQPQKRTCMCSPTNHPGSFRCSLHRSFNNSNSVTGYAPSNRLNARRSAMTNSLVRIGGVEGDLVKRALSALIRPSSHQQRRRAAFQPRPSRLSVMTRAGDL